MKRLYGMMVLLLLTLQAAAEKGEKALSRQEARQCAETLKAAWKDSLQTALHTAKDEMCLRLDSLTMPLHWELIGDEPADGRSLFISLHGGGGAPKAVNDSQWQNQWLLYHPDHSVYLCPRAPVDAWNMHFQTGFDEFYRRIIQMAVAFFNVNPNKVYLMGYSAGGDGVWRLGPRMADSWAAASMMAGHPGDVSLLNLRNTPFMIWCGELDAAYDRNKQCQMRIEEMDSLHRADPQGYIFEGHIVKGKGHWMDLEDKAALTWMAQYQRNPYPTTIVWHQEEELHRHFYWLSAPADELARGKEVRLSIMPPKNSKPNKPAKPSNTIIIERCDYSQLTLSLNDKMINLDKAVKVLYRGKTVFKGKVKRSAATLRHTLYERNDSEYMFPVQIQVKLNN